MIEAELPDGSIIEFPDGTAPDVVQRVVKTRLGIQEKTVPTTMQSVQASAPGRILQGMRDPIDSAAKLLPKGLEAITSLGGFAPNPVSQFFGSEAGRVQDINKANEAQYQAARQASGSDGMDIARFAGNVASPANLAMALRAAPALTTGARVLQGAKIGAAGGALSDTDVNDPDYWSQKAKDVALGGVIGGAVPAAIEGVSRVIKPQVNPQVQALMKEGVTPTPGQILGGKFATVEEKLQSVPILGEAIGSAKQKATQEFNKAALNRALKPIGEKVTTVGREGVEEVERKIGAVYDDILPKMTFKADQQFTQEMSQLQQMAQALGDKEASKFNSIMKDTLGRVNPQTGMMTGETLKTVQSKLTTEAKKFGSSSDAYQKELGEALMEAGRIVRDSLPRTNPQYASELAKANEAWANYARIRQAASSTATGAREGIFSPAQLAMAVRSADKTVGKGASAKGQALMQDLAEQGTQVLGSKVPDSGTAGRLAYMLGGGAAAINPSLLLGAGAAAPYLGPLRQATAAALTQRPAQAEAIANALRKSAPALAGAVPFAIGQQP